MLFTEKNPQLIPQLNPNRGMPYKNKSNIYLRSSDKLNLNCGLLLATKIFNYIITIKAIN